MNIQIGWGAFPSIALQVGAIQGNEIKCKGYCSKKRKNTPKISAGNGRKQSGEQIGKCPLRAALACISFFLEREGFLFLLTRESHFIPDQSAEYARDLRLSTPLLGRDWKKALQICLFVWEDSSVRSQKVLTSCATGRVCRILNISERTLQHYRDTFTLPFIQIGHKRDYKREDVEALLVKSNCR